MSEHAKKEGLNEQSNEESDISQKKKDRDNWIKLVVFSAALIIVLLLLVFVPSYLRQKQSQDDKYNGFDFVKREDNLWYTVVNKGDQPYSLPFYYHPRDLEDVVVDRNVRGKFFAIRDNNGSIFVAFDPDSESNRIVIAAVEVAKITGERYGLLNVPTRSAFTKSPGDALTDTEIPVKTCKDADNKTIVVWLVVTDKNLVSSNGYCVILEARNYTETIRVADRLVYDLLGIMN
jgi:hypothetical protein